MGADGYFEAIETIRLDLLEMMGRGYVIDHCVSHFLVENKRKIFEMYVATCLKNINEISAKSSRSGGPYIAKDYAELAGIVKKKPKDNRTAEEIAIDVMKKAGLKLGGE